MKPKPQKFFIGCKVVAIASGWTGTIVRKTKQKSSPWVCRWDKNGNESNVNSMVVTVEDDAQRLRKKIIKIEQLGFGAPRSELAEAKRRLAEIDQILSE